MDKKHQISSQEDTCSKMKRFLFSFNDFDYKNGARSDQIVPLEYFTMSKSCSEGLTSLVTIVVCSHRPWFQSISTHFEVSVVLIMKLFPHTLWGTQIPWFWALFEPPKIAHTQLQAPAINFLEVVWSWNRYAESTIGYKLSNAPSLVIKRCLDRSLRIFVQNPKSTTKKKGLL